VRPTYVPYAAPVTAPAPPQIIEGSFFGPQFMADMVLAESDRSGVSGVRFARRVWDPVCNLCTLAASAPPGTKRSRRGTWVEAEDAVALLLVNRCFPLVDILRSYGCSLQPNERLSRWGQGHDIPYR
jgi:hypothetical protein